MTENEELTPSVEESISVRFGDVTVSISASENGVLEGKTNEQIIKFCADLLLKTTDASSLENFLDTAISIEETLREDYNMKPLEISQFLINWRKRLYLKQIGEQNPPIEEFKSVRAIVEEPSSDDEADKKDVITPTPQLADGQVTIGLPLAENKILRPVTQPSEQNSFTVVEKDSK